MISTQVDGCSNGAEAFARSVSVGGSVVVVSDEDHDEASGAACVYRTTDGGDTWNHSTTLMLDEPCSRSMTCGSTTGDGFAGALRSNKETRVGARTVSTDGSVAVAGAYRRGVLGYKDVGGGYVFRVGARG